VASVKIKFKVPTTQHHRRKRSAPAHWRAISNVQYLFGLALYVKSLADHNVKLREVPDWLRTYWLKLQPDKCEYLRREVNCMGHQITAAGIRPDPLKVPAIMSFPTPTSVKQVRNLWGHKLLLKYHIEL